MQTFQIILVYGLFNTAAGAALDIISGRSNLKKLFSYEANIL